MILDTVSADAMRSAQIITGVAMAIWIGVGIVPPLQPYAYRVRGAVLALYLLGSLGFLAYALVGKS